MFIVREIPTLGPMLGSVGVWTQSGSVGRVVEGDVDQTLVITLGLSLIL